MLVNAVCSPKPRTSLQKGPKGGQWWGRDVWHIRRSGVSTLCGIDSSEWLHIGMVGIDDHTCARCVKKLTYQLPTPPMSETAKEE